MLDFQATDAVGMRVQSVAKIDGEPGRERGSPAGGKRFREGRECRTIPARLDVRDFSQLSPFRGHVTGLSRLLNSVTLFDSTNSRIVGLSGI